MPAQRRTPLPASFLRTTLLAGALTFLIVFYWGRWSSISLPVYYPTCASAHAAGKYSIKRGEPGYRWRLDADNDGLACEPYR